MYIKWKCKCDKVFISNTKRHHYFDSCDKCNAFVDAEEYGTRHSEGVTFLEEYDYDFLKEIFLSIEYQQLDIPFAFRDPQYMIVYPNPDLLTLEDEIMEGLK
jgi:hypothetical protein